jgi:hypothetical protein
LISLGGKKILRVMVEVRWRMVEATAELPCGFGAKLLKIAFQDEENIQAIVNTAIRKEGILAFVNKISNPASLSERISAIQNFSLSLEVQDFISEYSKYGDRDGFIWKWVYEGLRLTALSSVESTLWNKVQTIKLLGVMLDVMLDDAADQIQDKALVEQMLLIPFEESFIDRTKISSDHIEYFEFTVKLWKEIENRSQSLPRYLEFKDLLEFDYRQLLNCMRYALIVNDDPRRLNLAEHDLYQPHNMHMMVSSTLDLMASPRFDARETGMLREVVWNAQVMGRIGNAVTTWQRELKDQDYTSGIFAMALSRGVLTADDLKNMEPAEIEEHLLSACLEEAFLIEWGKRRESIAEMTTRINSIDIETLLNGLENLIAMHLGSRGLK